jgi:hypothetical protein
MVVNTFQLINNVSIQIGSHIDERDLCQFNWPKIIRLPYKHPYFGI